MPHELAGLRFYSLKEIAQELNMNTRTLQGYVRTRKLKALKIGKSYKIKEEDLKEFLLQSDYTPKKK